MKSIEKISLLMTNPKKIRNIALVAHIDHGKTTLSDSLLASAGVLAPSTAGEARALDFLPEEQRRGITMKTANISLVVKEGEEEYLVNLIDSPGHVDFSGKVARALRIADGAIVVIDAVEQVMAQTETVIRQCVSEGVKPVLFINKVDRLINELKLTPEKIAERLEIIYNQFNTLVSRFSEGTDLPSWKSTTKDGSVTFGSALHRWAISLPLVKGKNLTFTKISEFYRKKEIPTLQALVPIETALNYMIIHHLPDPITAQEYRIKRIWNGDISSTVGNAMRTCSAAPDVPVVFGSTKVLLDEHAGSLILGRVFSGILRPRAVASLSSSGEKGKIQTIFLFMGNDKKRVEAAPAGNIVAFSGMGHINPGETIFSGLDEITPFEDIHYLATPVVTIAVEPKLLRDLPKLKHILERFDLEDPNLIVSVDDKSGETLLMGLGELHLETVVHDISQEIDCSASDPLVIIVERLENSGKKVTNELFGSTVTLQAMILEKEKEPNQNQQESLVTYLRQYNNEIEIRQTIVEQLSNSAIENILLGAKDALITGPISGKPVAGVRIIVHDFQPGPEGEKFEHTVPLLRNTVWQSLKEGKISTQEPIYKIQITTPTAYLGKISSVISKRRGTVADVRANQDFLIISGSLPVAESFNIDHDLRSGTEGRAFWQMSFESYQPIPKSVLKEMEK